jgi:hypothetical protein
VGAMSRTASHGMDPIGRRSIKLVPDCLVGVLAGGSWGDKDSDDTLDRIKSPPRPQISLASTICRETSGNGAMMFAPMTLLRYRLMERPVLVPAAIGDFAADVTTIGTSIARFGFATELRRIREMAALDSDLCSLIFEGLTVVPLTH